MHPILVHIGSLTLYTYGLLVSLAFVIATLWILRNAEKNGEKPDNYLQAIFWILVSGFAGARLMYVVYFPKVYLHDPLRILLDRGGLVWYGGLTAAVITSLVFLKLKKISIPQFADKILPPAALGLAIGRIGCFLSGCCYGKPTHVPWAVQFPPGHETYPAWVHPTQLYETGGLILLVFFMMWLSRHTKTPGGVMSAFFIGYGIIRFIIEMFRGDVVYWVGNVLTASQVFSLIGIIGGVAFLLIAHSRNTPQLNGLSKT